MVYFNKSKTRSSGQFYFMPNQQYYNMKKNIEGFNESLGKGKKTIQKSVYFKRDKLYIQASSNCLETKKKINKPNKCFLHIFLSNLFDVLINSSYNEALKICVILIGISQTFLLQVAVANGTEASSDNIGGNGGAIGVTSGREASVAENVTTVGQARNGVAESVENKAYFDRAVAAVSSAWTNANQKLGPICKLILGEEKGCKDKNLSIPLLLVTIMIVSALIHYVYTQVCNNSIKINLYKSQNCYNSCCKKSLSEY
ncbi:variable surface protein, partial [Plasmodium gonderi]